MCGRAVAYGLLMCRYHWHRVSETTRRQVYIALDACGDGQGTLAQLRAAQARAVAEAR